VELYVRQCRDVLSFTKTRAGQDAAVVHISLAAYHLADAEYLLAKVHASR
jgi:hypothetical protein